MIDRVTIKVKRVFTTGAVEDGIFPDVSEDDRLPLQYWTEADDRHCQIGHRRDSECYRIGIKDASIRSDVNFRVWAESKSEFICDGPKVKREGRLFGVRLARVDCQFWCKLSGNRVEEGNGLTCLVQPFFKPVGSPVVIAQDKRLRSRAEIELLNIAEVEATRTEQASLVSPSGSHSVAAPHGEFERWRYD